MMMRTLFILSDDIHHWDGCRISQGIVAVVIVKAREGSQAGNEQCMIW
jgi:hypothetical protein